MKFEKIDSYTGQLEACPRDNWQNGFSCVDDEAGSISDRKQFFVWVDDYKCSICGIELPTSFIEERQEHSDFHLAERLQGEESGNNHRSFVRQQRYLLLHDVTDTRIYFRVLLSAMVSIISLPFVFPFPSQYWQCRLIFSEFLLGLPQNAILEAAVG